MGRRRSNSFAIDFQGRSQHRYALAIALSLKVDGISQQIDTFVAQILAAAAASQRLILRRFTRLSTLKNTVSGYSSTGKSGQVAAM